MLSAAAKAAEGGAGAAQAAAAAAGASAASAAATAAAVAAAADGGGASSAEGDVRGAAAGSKLDGQTVGVLGVELQAMASGPVDLRIGRVKQPRTGFVLLATPPRMSAYHLASECLPPAPTLPAQPLQLEARYSKGR